LITTSSSGEDLRELRHPVDVDVIDDGLVGLAGVAPTAERLLRIEIERDDLLAGGRGGDGEACGERRLAGAALGVGENDGSQRHAVMPWCTSAKARSCDGTKAGKR